MTTATDSTTPMRRVLLAECEEVIARGQQTFIEVGAALQTIRDGRLYRETHGTFEDYCRERWGWNASRARQLIGASEVATNLGGVTNVTPANEGQARALGKVPEEQRAEVWETVTSSEEKITARRIAEAAEVEEGAATTDDAPPWGDEDRWCWQLKNTYLQAPKRSQNAFRKWVATNPQRST